MSQHLSTTIAVIGVDIGKNSFHVVGLDQHSPIVLRQKWSRGQVESRFANIPPCLIGMERPAATRFSTWRRRTCWRAERASVQGVGA